jgi:hypothetical protein
MDSLTELRKPEPCDSCLYPAEGLVNHVGDRLCSSCRAVFWTAEALFDNKITDEAKIVPTMAFAAWDGRPWELRDEKICKRFVTEFLQRYEEFELVAVMEGVPVLRLKTVMADVIRYEGTDVPKQVRIRVLSRFASPKNVAELYERTLRAGNIPWDRTTRGSIEWDTEDAQLNVTVGRGETYHLAKVQRLANNPLQRWPSFPPPTLVQDMYQALLGSTDKRAFRGYAYGLGEHGRSKTKAAESVILACAAWFIGERDQAIEPEPPTKPKIRRPRIAQMLNRHLLGPLEKPLLPEDGWEPDDTVWRDARSLRDALQRTWYFLQKSRNLNNKSAKPLFR